MLIFKCDLCKKQWELSEQHKTMSPYPVVTYKSDKEEYDYRMWAKYCEICNKQIETAKEKAAEEAEKQMIAKLNKG